MPDREKVISLLAEISVYFKECRSNVSFASKDENHFWELQNAAQEAIALLKEQDAVSAHWDDDTGHWIEGDRDGIDPHTRTTGEMIDTFRCSWCGFYQYWKTPFCPNCGAKMEGR